MSYKFENAIRIKIRATHMTNINKCGSNNKTNGKYILNLLNNPKSHLTRFINHFKIFKYNTNNK